MRRINVILISVLTQSGIMKHSLSPRGVFLHSVTEHSIQEEKMFGLGFPELIIIMVIVLIIFGAGKLPEIGGAIGKGIKSFKKSIHEPDEIDVTPKDDQEKPKTP
jgi:sec-independent protein translocase protein TatA